MNETAAAPRRRRWPRVLVALTVLLLALALLGRWAMQPQRAVGFLLDRVGQALGLQVTVSGASRYRLRGTPQLLLHGLDARQPGATRPVLSAERVLLALPWSTIRARGTDLTIERIELDAPVLDLAALRSWQATRPPGQTRIPRLTRGLAIKRGRVIEQGWSLDAVGIDLPQLAPGEPLAAKVQGRYLDPPLRVDADLDVAMSQPAAQAGLGIVGTLDIVGEAFALPSHVRLHGPLRLQRDGLRMHPATLSMRAHYRTRRSDLPFALGVHGPVEFRDGTLALRAGALALRGRGTIPQADALGDVAFGGSLSLALDGRIRTWPDAWPALPPPIGQSDSPLPFTLRYAGAPDLADAADLVLQRDDTRFHARFHLPQVTRWVDAKMQPSPLPPLRGTLSTPRMDIAGAQLHGVEIEFDDPDIASPVQ